MITERAIIEAFELAEQILDELSSRNQDWTAIERMAGTLAELAASAARPLGARDAEMGGSKAT
jgi:hypothetical protein